MAVYESPNGIKVTVTSIEAERSTKPIPTVAIDIVAIAKMVAKECPNQFEQVFHEIMRIVYTP